MPDELPVMHQFRVTVNVVKNELFPGVVERAAQVLEGYPLWRLKRYLLNGSVPERACSGLELRDDVIAVPAQHPNEDIFWNIISRGALISTLWLLS